MENRGRFVEGDTVVRDVYTNGKLLKERREQNPLCDACKWFPSCFAGCRAVALATMGEKMSCDPFSCACWKNGWLEKTIQIMEQTPPYYNDSVLTVGSAARPFPLVVEAAKVVKVRPDRAVVMETACIVLCPQI